MEKLTTVLVLARHPTDTAHYPTNPHDMDVKTYRAATMQEALLLVRRELGPAASILHTREVRGNLLLRWLPGRRRIEVTAAADVHVPSRFPPRERAGDPADISPLAPAVHRPADPAAGNEF